MTTNFSNGDESSIEPVHNLDEQLLEDDTKQTVVSTFISEAFSLNQNSYVAEQIRKKKEMSKSSMKLALFKVAEKSGEEKEK